VGKIEKEGEGFVFRQDDGEITAWFNNIDLKKILAHDGSPTYKKLFYLLVSCGVIYLTFIFIAH
jgi:hypothetical protein